MGGQQFLAGETLVDMRLLNRITALDHDRGLITVEAGIEWPTLIAGYLALQRERDPSREPRWEIAQKQTGADTLTLGGALSANAHGRGLTMPPIVHDVESFILVNARGELITCSRSENAELFSLAIGGYGLFGVIVTVTLRLCERLPVRRVVRLIDIDDAVNAARRRIDAGFIYGDFQFDIDPNSPEFLTKGVFSCYEPALDARPPTAPARELAADDWEQLLLLAHTEKAKPFGWYAQHYIATDGQLYWSDTHQLGIYLEGYHERIDAALASPCRCSEMISEVYLPHDRLVDFLHDAARLLFDHTRHKSKRARVEETAVAELERGDHQKRHERKRHEGRAETRPKFLRLSGEPFVGRRHLFGGPVAHQSCNWKRHDFNPLGMHQRECSSGSKDSIDRARNCLATRSHRDHLM